MTAPRLEFEVRVPLLLQGLLLGLHLLLAVLIVTGPLFWLLPAALANGAYLWYEHCYWPLHRRISLIITRDRCQLSVDHNSDEVALLPSSVVWSRLALLRLRVPWRRRAVNLLLLPDSSRSGDLRRLRVMSRLAALPVVSRCPGMDRG